jgi:hypothetical protein
MMNTDASASMMVFDLGNSLQFSPSLIRIVAGGD